MACDSGKTGEEEPVVFTRARADTCDATLSPRRREGLSGRVSIISEPVTFTSRSTGYVSGSRLDKELVRSLDESKTGADATSVGVAPTTYIMRFSLSEAASWRGERCLFTRGDAAVTVPSVGVVGPYGTLRFRASSSSKGPKGGAALLSHSRGRKSNETVLNSSPESPLKADTEYHLAVVLGAEQIAYYINGELVRSRDLSKGSVLPGLTGSLTIGRSHHADGVPCTVHSFEVVCRAMTAEEVAADHEA